MWNIKKFKTSEAMKSFINVNGHKIQWHEVFVNNAYAIQYRPLKVIG